MSGEATKRKNKYAKGKGKKSLVEDHHETNGVSLGGNYLSTHELNLVSLILHMLNRIVLHVKCSYNVTK